MRDRPYADISVVDQMGPEPLGSTYVAALIPVEKSFTIFENIIVQPFSLDLGLGLSPQR